MTSNSKYVSPETIAEVEQRLLDLKEEDKELDLLEKFGQDVSEQRQSLKDARAKAQKFLSVYKR